MTDYGVKVGTRVRVTIEAEVRGFGAVVDGAGIETTRSWLEAEEIVSVEKVAPPLPTEPGVYVRAGADRPLHDLTLYVLMPTGQWYLDGAAQEQIEPPKGGLTRLVRES